MGNVTTTACHRQFVIKFKEGTYYTGKAYKSIANRRKSYTPDISKARVYTSEKRALKGFKSYASKCSSQLFEIVEIKTFASYQGKKEEQL